MTTPLLHQRLDYLLDCLSRRFDLLMATSAEVVAHEVKRFVDWVESDRTLAAYAQELRKREEQFRAKNARLREELLRSLRTLMKKLPETFPETQDTITSDDDSDDYYQSFVRIERLLDRVLDETIRKDRRLMERILMENVSETLGLLRHKMNLIGDPTNQKRHPLAKEFQRCEALSSAINAAEEHAEAVAPENAYVFLVQICDLLTKAAPEYASPDNWILKHVEDYKLRERLEKDKNASQIFAAIHRAYAELRAMTGSAVSNVSLIHSFKARTSWYDRRRLRSLVMETIRGKETFIRERERALVEELARYLFDCGVWALIRSKIDVSEFDLFAPLGNPVLIEGKAHIGGARKDIVRGLAQLHGYMVKLEGTPFHVTEAHYVVFRLGGPIYELPLRVTTNRFVIHTHIIDLGESRESGRKQPPPGIIREAEIFAAIEAESTASNNPRSLKRVRRKESSSKAWKQSRPRRSRSGKRVSDLTKSTRSV